MFIPFFRIYGQPKCKPSKMSASKPSFLRQLWNVGRKFATKHPVITNGITYGTIYTCAELTHQAIIGLGKFDFVRASHFTIVGTGFFGPIGFYWYRWLDGVLPGVARGVMIRKVLIDQLVCAAGSIVIFFVVMNILEGKKDVTSELKEKFAPTFAASCCFWPAAQVLNFYFLPTQYRVLYIASLGFVMKRLGEDGHLAHAKQKNEGEA